MASNVLFADYAGSPRCTPCHSEIAARFERSPMHRMTRAAESAEIHAPFDGSALRLGGDTVTMSSHGDRRYVELDSARGGQRVYRITEVIGGRYREDYVGVRVAGTGSRDRTYASPPTRLIMPVSWMLADREWRYKGYSVQIPERPGLSAGPVWNRTCIFCHNTVPYLATIYDDLGGPDHPRYQGHVPSNLLPANRRLRFEIQDRVGLAQALVAELGRMEDRDVDPGLGLDALLARSIRRTHERFDSDLLVELGIGCESCHGGSAEHASNPRVVPSYAPISPLFSVRSTSRDQNRASDINHACARCHSVLFSRYAYTWEGGRRAHEPGGSTINSGEARDFLLGGCASSMACTSCHDPHGEDERAALDRLATPAGNATCTGCHGELASSDALRAHSHHDPSGEGASCVGCHMPRKNAGLDYGLTRYHRIGSPSDPARVLADRPIECALCHGDASVESLARTMESWWGRRYDRAALRRLYGGDLSVSALDATLERGHPHEQAVAIDRLGHGGARRHLGPLADQLANELPLVRYFARQALERLTGQRPPLDMSLPGAELRAAGHAWLATLPDAQH